MGVVLMAGRYQELWYGRESRKPKYLKTAPVPFYSTWNASEMNSSCGEKPATTALAMA